MTNQGAVALDKWLTARGRGAASALAMEMGITPAMVSGWRSGDKKPVAKYRLDMEERGVAGARSWDQPAEPEAPSSQAPAA